MTEDKREPASSVNNQEADQHLEDVLSFIDDEYSQLELLPYMEDSDIETLHRLTSRQTRAETNDCQNFTEACQLLDSQLTTPSDGQVINQIQHTGLEVPDVEDEELDITHASMIDYPVYTPDESSEMEEDSSQKLFTAETARSETMTINEDDLFTCGFGEMVWMDTSIWDDTKPLEDTNPECEVSDNVNCNDEMPNTTRSQSQVGSRGRKLTPEGAGERKRLLNRKAAKRCRDKKLKKHQDLEKRVESLRSQHDFLRQLRQRLVQTWAANKGK